MAVVYGLDTGAWKLRLAAMEGKFGRPALRDVQEVARTPGDVSVPDALKALREAEPRWEEGERCAGLPLEVGVVRLIRLPFTDRAAVERAVPAEVESQAPYELEEMLLVSKLLDARENVSRTVVHIAPRDAVKARLDELGAAGAEPRTLCLDAAALAGYAERGVQLVLDVGHVRTVAALCQNGQLVGARVLPMGDKALTEVVARAAGVDTTVAEAMKHQMVLAPGAAAPGGAPRLAVVPEWEGEERTETNAKIAALGPEEALRREVEQQLAALRAELIALEDELEVGVDEVLLAGGGSRLGGFPELLSERLGVPVRPVVVAGGYPPECALAVALARVGGGDWKAEDLRVEEFAFHGVADVLWNVTAWSTVGAAVALLASAVMFGVQYWDTTQRLAELDEKISGVVTDTFPDVSPASVKEASMAVAIMQERVGAMQERVNRLGSIVSGTPPTLDMLRTLTQNVPRTKEARIDVRELTIAEDAISMKAETDSYESASKIEESLQREPRFSGAQKSDEKKLGEALSFTVNIPLGAAEGAAPAEGEEG